MWWRGFRLSHYISCRCSCHSMCVTPRCSVMSTMFILTLRYYVTLRCMKLSSIHDLIYTVGLSLVKPQCHDEFIFKLSSVLYSRHVTHIFIGCVLYADDIVLLSASCHGLQQLVNICNVYGTKWDIKFTPLKSQVITFGGQNPCCQIMLNSNQIPWVNKVKYLGVHFCCNTGITDLSDICRKFYGQFNSILSVLGKCLNEMAAVHLTKT